MQQLDLNNLDASNPNLCEWHAKQENKNKQSVFSQVWKACSM